MIWFLIRFQNELKMSYRIDKYIWCVRLAKTRYRATNGISNGKVKLNGTLSKPSKEVKLGDEIQVTRHNSVYSFKIIQLVQNGLQIILLTPPQNRKKKNTALIVMLKAPIDQQEWENQQQKNGVIWRILWMNGIRL